MQDDGFALDEVALWIAAEHDEGLDVPEALAQLNEWAEQADTWVGDARLDEPTELISRFHRYFFGELAFSGNQSRYYDERNSFLHKVMERRTGIPITLTVIYQEIARRCGWPVAGVGFPSHFLARWELAHQTVIVDVFNGVTLSREDCAQLLSRATKGQTRFDDSLLSPTSYRATCVRILNNLRALWVRAEDYVSAISACDRILLLAPDTASVIRDRGLMWLRLECHRPAAKDLERYVELDPKAPDASAIRERLDEVRVMVRQIS